MLAPNAGGAGQRTSLEILDDRMKTAVLGEDGSGHFIHNPTLIDRLTPSGEQLATAGSFGQ